MKKIFLIIGIVAFSFTSAQQNDLLDVQKLIHKKFEAKKKLSSDSLYIQHRSCFEPIKLSPRGNKILQEKINADIFRKLLDNNNAYSYRFPNTLQSPSPLGTLSHVLPNGNKVYMLPQDHMPCIVPDMSQYNSMALVNPDIQQYNIPNPAYPPQSKVDPLSPEKLKELQELLNKMSKNTN
jgi:hypothetical protein